MQFRAWGPGPAKFDCSFYSGRIGRATRIKLQIVGSTDMMAHVYSTVQGLPGMLCVMVHCWGFRAFNNSSNKVWTSYYIFTNADLMWCLSIIEVG